MLLSTIILYNKLPYYKISNIAYYTYYFELIFRRNEGDFVYQVTTIDELFIIVIK